MPNVIGMTLFAAALQFTHIAAAQGPGEVAHNRVANDEQLSDAASLHQRALGSLNDGNHKRALEDFHASIQLNPYYTRVLLPARADFCDAEGLRPGDTRL